MTSENVKNVAVLIDGDLFDDLMTYIEKSLPIHKRVGGALDQKRLLDRLKDSKFRAVVRHDTRTASSIPPIEDDPSIPDREAYMEAVDFFERLKE